MSLATIRGHLRSSFRALGHRNYRLYWTGQLISLIGTWMQSVAQGWLMHHLTGSALMLGFLGFAQLLPVLLLSLWPGVRFAAKRTVETMMKGIGYARSVPSLRNLLHLMGLTAGLGFQYMSLLPAYAREILQAEPTGYGLLLSAFRLGSLVSASWMTR